jgi:hypothetical protein
MGLCTQQQEEDFFYVLVEPATINDPSIHPSIQ